MKLVKAISVLCVLFFISGCTSITVGKVQSSYSPVSIDGANVNDSATVKTARGLIIWKVDRDRKVSIPKVMFGKGLDSILVTEGEHSIGGSLKGTDINISKTHYKSGHEYIINYVINGDQIRYWVKDLTNDEVIYGTEVLVD